MYKDEVIEILSKADLKRMRIESVAEELSMSRTSLVRHLAAEYTSYGELLQRERIRRLANLLMEAPDARGDQMCDALGYWETNSFYRWFKSWFGVTYQQRNSFCAVVV